jgi:4-hydroxybenzoate polyprenyltransferase
MSWILRLVRFPNLVIVALTQYLLFYFLLLPAFHKAQLLPLLDHFHFFLLVLDTMLIAAGGYVINDYYDQEIDLRNKPDKRIVGIKLSGRAALWLYASILLSGATLALYLAIHVENLPLFGLYPLACLGLWLYSRFWKKAFLIGNILVSIFCAFVAGIVWFAERATYTLLWDGSLELGIKLQFLLSAYLLFAFLSTMYREIIKDIEDREGDAMENGRTLPIVLGVNIGKWVSFLFGILLLFVMIWLASHFILLNQPTKVILLGLLGIAPLLFSFMLLRKARRKSDFYQLSQIAKFIMFAGILLIPFLW